MMGKWIKVQALLDSEEMHSLFKEMGDFFIFNVSDLCKKGESNIAKEAFLRCYDTYIEELRNGHMCTDEHFRSYFSSVFTNNKNAIEMMNIGDKELVKMLQPVIQLQSHSLHYSPIDSKFRSMVFGKETISWGLQFSYPQIIENPTTREIEQVKDNFSNTSLFRILRKWIRHHTIPTPFLVNSIKTNVPIRLGKKCLPWINQHPQLQAKSIRVKNEN